MIKYAALVRVVLARDVDACLLVEPPAWQAEFGSDCPRLIDHDPVRNKHGVNIACDATCIVGKGHRCATHDEDVGHDAAPDQSVAQGGKCPLEISAPEEDLVGAAQAASRSLADR